MGRLVPEFVFFGPDMNSLWVTTTTYEGVSLRELMRVDGGRLDPAVKRAALEALGALHACGVVHGDAELRNAVWRGREHGRGGAATGSVVWVDLERAIVRRRGHLENDESFDALARAELARFEAVLREVPDGVPVEQPVTEPPPRPEPIAKTTPAPEPMPSASSVDAAKQTTSPAREGAPSGGGGGGGGAWPACLKRSRVMPCCLG